MISQSTPQYWDKTVGEFDAIYSGEKKTAIGVFLDRWLRQDIYVRIDETVKIVNQLGKGLSVLDIGTGTGRLCIPLAKAGHHIVGVDFSQEMLNQAEQITTHAGVNEHCRFLKGDMLHEIPPGLSEYTHFDVVAALGVLDYIADPLPMLKNMQTFSPQKIVISYPKQGTLRSIVRQLRYKIQRLDCPLYFYTPAQIEAMGKAIQAKTTQIEEIGELYFTVYHF